MTAMPRSSLHPTLRVAVCLAEPWAYADGLCLDGIEVRAMRRYSRWRGRDLCWLHVPEAQLPRALAEGRVDIAIGGLCRNDLLARSARLVDFSRRPLCSGEPRHGVRQRQVWAVSHANLPEWLGIRVFLKLRQWRERFSGEAAGGTEAAFSHPRSQEYPQ